MTTHQHIALAYGQGKTHQDSVIAAMKSMPNTIALRVLSMSHSITRIIDTKLETTTYECTIIYVVETEST